VGFIRLSNFYGGFKNVKIGEECRVERFLLPILLSSGASRDTKKGIAAKRRGLIYVSPLS
jgi:hypothetical protein